MPKIFQEFDPNLIPAEESEEVKFTKKNYIVLLILVGSILLWGTGLIYLETKTIMPTEKKVLETINMRKGYILVQQVKYETYKKIDPNDTGDIYFEVVKSIQQEYKEGDLVKFNPRFIEKVEIENGSYVILDASQIQFSINKEDVKTSLLKR